MTRTSPFTNAAQGFADLAANLGAAKSALATLTFNGEGKVADQINENLERYAEVIGKLEEGANTTSEDAQKQADADEELLNAPSEEEVEELKQKYLEVKRKAANGEATDQELEDAQNAYLDAKKQREEALKKHTEETEFSNLNTGTDDDEEDTSSSPSTSDTGTSPSSGSSLGGDDEAGTPGDTELSSDGSQTPQQSMMNQPQAQQAQQQPQASAQPQMSGASPQQQQQQPQSNKSAPPNMPSYQGPRESGLKKDGKDPLAFLNDRKVNTNVSGSASPFLNDRGTSVTGVTSKADTSGMNSPSVTTSGAQPGSGDQRGNQTGGRMGGMGGMGGMMGGGMGGAQGAGAGSKEKPEIFTQDKDLLGKESLDQAIEGGMIGRDTSAPTTHGEGR